MPQNKHYDMNDIATRFISILRENIDTETGQAIVLKMVGEMNDERCGIIADECEDMVRFRNYLSEDEANSIMTKFVNFDGSRGPHWDDADAAFRALSSLDIEYEKTGEYNKWAFLAVLNMIWSDEWGVLRNYATSEQEVRVCAELAASRLEDRDRVFSVRRYFKM
jgi:hypothetical protein